MDANYNNGNIVSEEEKAKNKELHANDNIANKNATVASYCKIDGQNKTKKQHKQLKLDGFAVLEGVMIRGENYYATAVRDPENIIQIESKVVKKKKILSFFKFIPMIRGIIYFFTTLFLSIKILYRSTEMSIDDTSSGKIDKWMEDKLKINISTTLSFLFMIILITFAIVLFLWFPIYIANKITLLRWKWFAKGGVAYYLFQGLLRLIIFLFYLVIITFIPPIKRILQYFGAQHKTLNCVAAGKDVTVENIQNSSRIYDRCKITFVYLTVVLSIILFPILEIFLSKISLAIASNALGIFVQMLIRLAIIPVAAGLTYEIFNLLAYSQSVLLIPFKAPSYFLQVLIIKEPTEEMIQVAVAAYQTVVDMENGKKIQIKEFIFSRTVRQYLKDLKARFAEQGIDESDAEWLLSIKTDIPRSELMDSRVILMPSKVKQLEGFVQARIAGKPLWYVLGSMSFYGSEFLVDARVLIPRPETELLTEQAIKLVDNNSKVLDMCTGSGCIAITLAKECRRLNLAVTASDISAEAIQLAQKNANINGTNIQFVESNMFQNIQGKYDLIVCNPPYIKSEDIPYLQPEVSRYEPLLALDGGRDGLDFYRILAKEAPQYLNKGGTLLLECGKGQTEEIVKMLDKFEFTMVTRDLDGIERFIRAIL